MEAATRIELVNNGFADRCLSRLAMPPSIYIFWSGRTDLNRRRPPWQGGTLPLSYARSVFGGDYNKYYLFVNMNFDDAVVCKLIVLRAGILLFVGIAIEHEKIIKAGMDRKP